MQRGARFSILLSFWTCLGAPEVGPSGGVETSIKPMLFEGISKLWAIMGILGAAAKSIPKNEIGKICPENECFVRFLPELFGAHLGLSIFLGAHASLLQWPLPMRQKAFPLQPRLLLDALGGVLRGDPSGPSGRNKRSHAACGSFRVSPEHSHAAWGSFCLGRDCSHAAWGSFFLKQLRSHAGLRWIWSHTRTPWDGLGSGRSWAILGRSWAVLGRSWVTSLFFKQVEKKRDEDRQSDRQPERQTDRRTDTQTDRQTDRNGDRQTDRQTERQTDREGHEELHQQGERAKHKHQKPKEETLYYKISNSRSTAPGGCYVSSSSSSSSSK